MSTKQRIFIPTYISSVDYQPARVQPRLLFYNGLKDCEPYFVASGSITLATNQALESFPYFDNYSGQNTTTESLSLLFFNEEAPYGETPTASLYTEYWEDYVELLYNPRTRLINASAIIPLADYFKMELNDIVEFRSNTYHLRAINDYSLTDGTCKIQLLGPILEGALQLPPPPLPQCSFTFSSSLAPVTTTTTSTSTSTTTAGPTTTSTTTIPVTTTTTSTSTTTSTTTIAPTTTTTTTAGTTTSTTTAPPTTTTTTAPLFKYRAEFYICQLGTCVLQSFTTIQTVEALSINRFYRIANGNIFRPIEVSTAALATTITPVDSSLTCNTLCVVTTTSTTTLPPTTTTTTTFSPDPCNCVEVNITSAGGEVATFNCFGQNQNYVYATAGTRYLCAAVIGGLLQAEIVSGTGTVTPVGDCKTGTCPPPTTTTTSTTTAPPTTTTTTVNCNFTYGSEVVSSFKYNAEFYLCDIVTCVLQSTTKIDSSSELILNRFYIGANGFIFRPTSVSTSGSHLAFTPIASSATCNTLCTL